MRVMTIGRLVLLVLLVTLVLAPPSAQAEALVEVTPADTPARFDVIATGFAANEMVSTWLTGPSQQVVPSDRRKVDHNGGIAFSMRLKRYFEPGRWALTVGGWESGREAIAYFDLAPATPDFPVVVTPSSGSAGTTFDFATTGFDEAESVSVWLTAPDGQAVTVDAFEAGRTGNIEFSWSTTSDTPTGAWTVNAYGQESDRLGVATFDIT